MVDYWRLSSIHADKKWRLEQLCGNRSRTHCSYLSKAVNIESGLFWWALFLLFIYSVAPLPMGWLKLPIQDESSSSVNSLWKLSHSYAQRCFPWVILNSVKLTMNMKPHTAYFTSGCKFKLQYNRDYILKSWQAKQLPRILKSALSFLLFYNIFHIFSL